MTKKRKTIDLPKDVAKQLQYLALKRDISFTRLLNNIIEEWAKINCPSN